MKTLLIGLTLLLVMALPAVAGERTTMALGEGCAVDWYNYDVSVEITPPRFPVQLSSAESALMFGDVGVMAYQVSGERIGVIVLTDHDHPRENPAYEFTVFYNAALGRPYQVWCGDVVLRYSETSALVGVLNG